MIHDQTTGTLYQVGHWYKYAFLDYAYAYAYA